MKFDLDIIVTEAKKLLETGENPEDIRIKFLGRKSQLTEILKSLKTLPISEKKKIGALANQVKTEIETAITDKVNDRKQPDQYTDLTLPGLNPKLGTIHPVRQMQQEIISIFSKLGFSVTNTPELETDWYNFESLNVDEHHPARDDQDSFYIDQNHLLRTQTTAFHLRVLEKQKPPVRILNTGKIFRRDEIDSTHTPTFHQVDGLIVDEQVTFADLKGLLTFMAQQIFTSDTKTRFRISYFPFVEPGAEMDISCSICQQQNKSCPVCKDSGWVEILGCGMVHPKILHRAGLNSRKYQGLAFGMGVERPFMLKYQVPKIRMLYENDLRFLSQFNKINYY